MAFSTTAKNKALAALTANTRVELYNSSNVKLSGGNPAYAGIVPTWGAPASGEARTTARLTFNIPMGSSVKYIKIVDTSTVDDIVLDTYTMPDSQVSQYATQGFFSIPQIIWTLNK